TDGGIEVIAPSVTADGEYRWLGEGLRPVSELPVAKVGWTRERVRRAVTPTIELPDNPDQMFRRARGWLACVEGAVSGRRGHDRTFRVACRLTHPPPGGFGLSFADAWVLMQMWNEVCEPPWSDPELEHK